MRHALVLGSLAGVVLASVAPAARQEPVFRSSTASVLVDVLVRQRGQPVVGLTLKDFEVRDNNVVQVLSEVSPQTRPISLSLVVDLSGSVDGVLLESLTRAIRAIGRGLRPDDRFRVMTFNHAITLARDFDAGRPEALATLQLDTPRGQTALVDAIAMAALVPSTPERRNLVIVFTDGRDTTSILDETTVLDVAARGDAAVFVVAVADGTRRTPKTVEQLPFFQALVEATGGAVAVLQRDEDLGASFVSTVEEFRTGYLVGYAAGAAPGYHAIAVRIRRSGTFEVRARRGYFTK